MNIQARLTFFFDALHSSDNRDTGRQPSQVVGRQGPAQAWDGQSNQCSERCASDLPPNDPHLILQLDLPGRCDSSGGRPTTYSNPSVRGNVLCISDPI